MATRWSIDSFGLTYIDASDGPTLGEAQLVEAADISMPPGIISRTGWGADESLRFANGVEIFPPQYAPIRHGIVHHSETPNADDPAAQMRSIYYYHAVTRAWGDIGYNYLVDKYGNIYQGRVGGQGVIGNHSMAHNVGAVGVCLIGNHLIQNPTPAAVSGVGRDSGVCLARTRSARILGFVGSASISPRFAGIAMSTTPPVPAILPMTIWPPFATRWRKSRPIRRQDRQAVSLSVTWSPLPPTMALP